MAKGAGGWSPFSSKVAPAWGKSEKGIVIGPSAGASKPSSLGKVAPGTARELSLPDREPRVTYTYEYSSPRIHEISEEISMSREGSEGAMERARAARAARAAIVARRVSRRMPGMLTTPTSPQLTPQNDTEVDFEAPNASRRSSRRMSGRTTTPPASPKTEAWPHTEEVEFGAANVVRRSRMSRRMSGRTTTPPASPKTDKEVDFCVEDF